MLPINVESMFLMFPMESIRATVYENRLWISSYLFVAVCVCVVSVSITLTT